VAYVAGNIAFFDLGQHRTPASIWTARPTSPPSSGLSCPSGSNHAKCIQLCHDPNTPPAAFPVISGPKIRLPGQHGKVRRDGYCGEAGEARG
jgi:hypothetical protein